MSDHANRSTPEECPYLTQFVAMSMDERWVNRSPETMLDTFHWFRGEAFDLIVEDLLAMPTATPVIAEGFRLLPHLVQPLLAASDHAAWLLPTPEFRYAAFERRGSLWTMPRKTNDPERALRNLLTRDQLFTDRLHQETRGLGLRAIDVDSTVAEDDLVRQVADAFRL